MIAFPSSAARRRKNCVRIVLFSRHLALWRAMSHVDSKEFLLKIIESLNWRTFIRFFTFFFSFCLIQPPHTNTHSKHTHTHSHTYISNILTHAWTYRWTPAKSYFSTNLLFLFSFFSFFIPNHAQQLTIPVFHKTLWLSFTQLRVGLLQCGPCAAF